MPNKHAFSSTVVEKHEFESQIKSQRTFASQVISSRFFESIIEGFTVSGTWLANIINTNVISVSKILTTTKISGSIIIESIAITIPTTLMNIVNKFNPTFVQTNTITVTMRMAQKMGIATIQLANNIVVRLSDKLKLSGYTMTIPTIAITATPTARKYYLVSDWDASLLSDLDGMNLSVLDSQVV
jgi:hypothetical protein